MLVMNAGQLKAQIADARDDAAVIIEAFEYGTYGSVKLAVTRVLLVGGKTDDPAVVIQARET